MEKRTPPKKVGAILTNANDQDDFGSRLFLRASNKKATLPTLCPYPGEPCTQIKPTEV